MPPLSRSGRLARPSSGRRRLRLEALEGRHLLATIPVTTFADVTNPGDGVTSLREAIAKAAADPGPDDVELPGTINDVQGRYLLSQNQLTIDDAAPVTIRSVGGPATIDAGRGSRVVFVQTGSTANFRGLTITGGAADIGAGLLNLGTTTIAATTFHTNSATVGGGAIFTFPGSTTSLTDSVIASNTAASFGGGLSNAGRLVMTRVRVADNSAFGQQFGGNGGGLDTIGDVEATDTNFERNSARFDGGAIGNGGTLVVRGGTIGGNRASGNGGGIFNSGDGRMTIAGASLVTNQTPNFGGAIFTVGQASIGGATITGNAAFAGGGISAVGGNRVDLTGGNLSGNSASFGGGILVNRSTLNVAGGTLAGNRANNNGGAVAVENGGLARLAGATVTGNSAFAGGGISVIGGSLVDVTDGNLFGNSASFGGGILVNRSMLGVTRGTLAGNRANNNGGAVAAENGAATTLAGATLIGNTAFAGGGISAVIGARVEVTDSILSGNSASFGGAALVNGYDQFSRSTLRVTRGTLAANLANSNGGAVAVENGGSASIAAATLTGNTANSGAAISAVNNINFFTDVTLTGSTVSGNKARVDGGAFNIFRSTVGLYGSTLAENSAVRFAGAILNNYGDLTLVNSTLSGNSAGVNAGAIGNPGGRVLISASTITRNSAGLNTGGVENPDGFGGSVVLVGSIVAGNTAATNPDVYGPILSGGFNLIGDGTGSTGLVAPGDLVGTSASPINPRLGPLRNNGGPTPTHAPLPGSPAIDAGPDRPLVEADQRGVARPQGLRSDIGAVEVAFRPAVIAVKPGGDVAPINLNSRGVLPVAILSTDGFNAADVLRSDLSSIRIGDATRAVDVAPLRANLEDVDGDGDLDLILKFSIEDLVSSGALTANTTALTLTGFTADGLGIIGSQAIRIVGGKTLPPRDLTSAIVPIAPPQADPAFGVSSPGSPPRRRTPQEETSDDRGRSANDGEA